MGGRGISPHLLDFLRDAADGETVEADPIREDAGEDPAIQLEGNLSNDALHGYQFGICKDQGGISSQSSRIPQ